MNTFRTRIRVTIPDEYSSNVLQDLNLVGNNIIIEDQDFNIFAMELTDFQQVQRIEDILDRWRARVRDIRYHIFIYEGGSEWPRSIRINRLGKKIITKRQTKFGGL